MMGLVWYAATLAGGFIWLGGSSVASSLTTVEILWGGLAVGTIIPAFVTYLIGCCLSMLEIQTLILSNLLMLYCVAERVPAFMAEVKRRAKRGFAGERLDAVISTILIAVASAFFWPLYTTRMIPSDEHGRVYSGGSCWADLPIHMTIAESFLTGRNQDVSWGDMHSPVFAGEKMYYPFIPDWHAAVMVKLGATMRWGFLAPGFVMCLSFIGLFYSFAVRLTRSRIGAIIGLLLTIGSGGQGGINILMRDGLKRALEQDVIQNDVTGDGKVFWFAFVPHVFLPQRGANFAYPLALLVLTLVWKATDFTSGSMAPGDKRRLLQYAAALAALTPLVQAHTFIGLALIIGTVFVLDAHKWMADLRILGGWIAAGVVAAILGWPQMALFRKHVEKGHGGSFIKQGWIHRNHDFGRDAPGLWGMIPMAGAFFRFWWMSLGPAVPLFFVALAIYAFDSYKGLLLRKKPLTAAGAASTADSASGASTGKATDEDAASGRASGVSSSTSGSALRQRNKGDSDDDSDASADSDDAAAAKKGKNAVGGTFTASGPDVSLAEHLVAVTLAQLPTPLSNVLSGRTPVRYTALDNLLRPANDCSVHGRSLDALKFGVGALLVFLFGNYVNLQPWDRDNCKLFYIWVFIATALVGSLLAAPFEYILGLGASSAGPARVYQAVMVPQRDLLVFNAAVSRPSSGSGSSAKSSAAEHIGVGRRRIAGTVSLIWLLAVPVLMFFACASGFMLFAREYNLYHQLLDEDQIRMGNYIKEHLAPKSVIMHRDIHIMPSSCIAGRPSLVAYTGWMWSHGYNYYDRDRDRKYVMDNCLKDSDPEAYNAMRRWGTRYVLGEHLPTHHRPKQQQHEEAVARKAAAKTQQEKDSVFVPPFDPDLYLDGQLKRVFRSGRMELFEVLGYGFPPN